MTRWHLGERLAKVGRGKRGPKSENCFSEEKQYVAMLDKIGLATRQAQEAQRIACLPPDEHQAFCDHTSLEL